MAGADALLAPVGAHAGRYKGACGLALSEANKHVPLLPGGLDGTYAVHSCENGRPSYLRKNSPPGRATLEPGNLPDLCPSALLGVRS